MNRLQRLGSTVLVTPRAKGQLLLLLCLRVVWLLTAAVVMTTAVLLVCVSQEHGRKCHGQGDEREDLGRHRLHGSALEVVTGKL